MDLFSEIPELIEKDIYMIAFGGGSDRNIRRNRIRRIEGDGGIYFQEERLVGSKAFHNNISTGKLGEYVSSLLDGIFRNAVIYTGTADYHIRISKKGKLFANKVRPTMEAEPARGHDMVRNYLIPEGKPVDFLVSLGIMDKDGKVHPKSYSKFRQINRFLELIDDERGKFSGRDKVLVHDLGCGKGYLTLAVHHYFNEILGMETDITGTDLKDDVIGNLNGIIRELGLKGISFRSGNIADAELGNPDLVVALHACDTATDLALSKAADAGTGLIMAVPCCQHELFNRIANESLEPMLKYGIMKDKFTELATNALRGLALEARGYEVDMIEFTPLEHTMKNILIRAHGKGAVNPDKIREFDEFSELLGVESSCRMILPRLG